MSPPTRDSDEDPPDIGSRKGDSLLVCHGDDSPEVFADWLSPLVEDFESLLALIEEHEVDVVPPASQPPIDSVIEFCEYMGINFQSSSW